MEPLFISELRERQREGTAFLTHIARNKAKILQQTQSEGMDLGPITIGTMAVLRFGNCTISHGTQNTLLFIQNTLLYSERYFLDKDI